MGTLNQQDSELPVTGLTDAQLLVDSPGLMPTRNKPEIGADIARLVKSVRVTNR
jgi:hypothetical protein